MILTLLFHNIHRQRSNKRHWEHEDLVKIFIYGERNLSSCLFPEDIYINYITLHMYPRTNVCPETES